MIDEEHRFQVRQRRILTAACSIVAYLAFILSLCIPQVRTICINCLGPKKMGLPNLVFMMLLISIVYAPLPLVFWHLFRLVLQAERDGTWRWSKLGLAQAILEPRENGPPMGWSRVIVVLGFLYSVGLIVAACALVR